MHDTSCRQTHPRYVPDRRFTRRVLAKATAAFGAATVVGNALGGSRQTVAQDTSTVAGVWKQPTTSDAASGFQQFQTESAFRAIAPHWSDEIAQPAAIEVSVSADGEAFSEPRVIGASQADAGPLDRDGRVFGQLMMTELSSYVRYRALDANGSQITVPELEFTYIDAIGGPGLRDLQEAAEPESLERPPIITRDQWGASLAYDGWDGGNYEWTAEYRTVEHIIIHHSETPSFRDPLVAIRSIHYYHAVTRGWGDIGYNYLVDYLGNVYEGRKGGENVVGGHAYQYAYGSAGVCSMGSFSLETSTPEAIAGLVWISAWAARNLDPLARKDFHETPNLPTIAAHRDVNESSCPGDALYADLPYIRWATAEVLAGSINAQASPGFMPGEVIETTVDEAILRSGPTTRSEVEATLIFGTILSVVEGPTTNDGHIWYRVSGQRSAGWLATTTFGASTDAPPERHYEYGSNVEIATDLLNIRTQPDLYSDIVATLTTGDSATVVDRTDSAEGVPWLNVDTALGTGWVAEQFVAPSGRSWVNSSFATGDKVTVATNALLLRAEASRRATELAVLWDGTNATVIGGPRQSAGVTWLQIETPYGSGWVDDQYLGDQASTSAATPRFSLGDDVVVDTDALNVRETAGVTARIATTVWTGALAVISDGPISRDDYQWYEIETDDGAGWVVDQFLSAANSERASASAFEPGTPIEVATDAVNVRDDASTDAEIIGVFFAGETGSVVGETVRAERHTWVNVRFGSTSGWAASSWLTKSSGSPSTVSGLAAGDNAEVTSDNLTVRKAPSLSSDAVGELATGDSVSVAAGPQEADGFRWYQVEAGSASGWTVDAWLRGTDTAALMPGSSATVFGGELNLRLGPSTIDDIVAILPDGAPVDVLDGPESDSQNDWFRINSSRYGTGWTSGAWLRRA